MSMTRMDYVKIAKVVKGVHSSLRAGYFIDDESYFFLAGFNGLISTPVLSAVLPFIL